MDQVDWRIPESSNLLDPYIILVQLFKLFSAVGSVSQIKKIGKSMFLAVFACTVKRFM